MSPAASCEAPAKPAAIHAHLVAVAGGWTSLALKSDGTVWEWYGTALAPVSGLTEVVAIARLYRHSLAVKSDGTVWEWGDNNGSPGDGL